MPFKIGNKSGSNIYKGTTEISKVYKGTDLVFSGAEYYLSFDGVDDYVDLGNSFNLSTITVEIDFYMNSANNFYPLISNRPSRTASVSESGYFLYITEDTLRIHVGNGSSFDVIDTVFNPSNNLNKYIHVAFTHNGSQLRIYIDGIEDPNSPISTSGLSNSLENMWLGHDKLEDYFDGEMREVRIWNVARTQQEIINNKDIVLTGNEGGLVAYYKFDEGSGTTLGDSAGNNDATIFGATWEQ